MPKKHVYASYHTGTWKTIKQIKAQRDGLTGPLRALHTGPKIRITCILFVQL